MTYLATATGKPLMTNEVGQYRVDAAQLTNTVSALRRLGAAYAVWMDGDGNTAFALHNGDNTLRDNGKALAAFTANPSAAGPLQQDQFGLSGTWYNPATSGQGLFLVDMPDFISAGLGQLFAGWYTFDVAPAGGAEKQRWYTLQGSVSSLTSSNTFVIYASNGGNFNAPPAATAVAVGYATLQFSDCTHATLSYLFTDGSGRAASMPLQRLTPNVACVASGPASPANAAGLSGVWYDKATSGQGMVSEVNPARNLFIAGWYTYAQNAQTLGSAGERWYVLQGNYVPGTTSMDVGIYTATGGVFDQTAPVASTQLGTANLNFADCNTASLNFQFTTGDNAGLAGTIPLQRLGSTPAGCTVPVPAVPPQ